MTEFDRWWAQRIAVAAVGIVATGWLSGHQSSPSATTNMATTSTKTMTVTPTPRPLKLQVREWYDAVQPYFAELDDAGQSMVAAARNEDLTDFGIACQQLHDAAANIQDHMPTPDPDLTMQVQGAISDFDAASHFCVSGPKTSMLGNSMMPFPCLRLPRQRWIPR